MRLPPLENDVQKRNLQINPGTAPEQPVRAFYPDDRLRPARWHSQCEDLFLYSMQAHETRRLSRLEMAQNGFSGGLLQIPHRLSLDEDRHPQGSSFQPAFWRVLYDQDEFGEAALHKRSEVGPGAATPSADDPATRGRSLRFGAFGIWDVRGKEGSSPERGRLRLEAAGQASSLSAKKRLR